MRYHICCGFTLVELMIVIAIMGVLVSLLVPAVQGVWTVADDHRCTTNLYYLSQAIAMRRGDVSMSSRSELRTLKWTTQLMPYLEQAGAILMCPVPSVVESPSDVADVPAGGSSGWWGQGPDEEASSASSDAYNAYPPLTEIAEMKIGSRFVAMDAGPLVVKQSDEQYQAAFAQGWFGGDNNNKDTRSQLNCTYSPGTNPNLYYLCFEDAVSATGEAGGDKDFNDVVMRVLDKRDGTYELSASTATAGSHALVSKPEGQTLMPLGGMSPMTPRGSVGLAEEGSSSATSGLSGNMPNFSDPDLGSGGGSSTILSSNYAMNADNKYLNYRPGKVALMDYYRYIFHYTDDWGALDPNRDGKPNFARHGGRINVLFTDGSVQFMDPAELDPANLDACLRYWAP
jgi:prepilin-type N-terminal cleavage/methylation domain-containing protein/prepilin-type processing-associated H-X9-DG protein